MKKAYLLTSWNPFDCILINLKVFTTKKGAEKFVKDYKLDTEKEEEIDLIEVELG